MNTDGVRVGISRGRRGGSSTASPTNASRTGLSSVPKPPCWRLWDESHRRYQQQLAELDTIDFAGLQREALLLLCDSSLAARLGAYFRHILVDEYQDTNFAQQEIIFRLAEAHRNICVVGDEDQLLYRFRGANPDGFGAFRRRFPDAATHRLTANYRSHRQIVALCNRWITSFDWSNPLSGGAPFRHPKLIVPRAVHANDNHPGVVSVLGHDQTAEGRQIAELLHLLKDRGFIGDFDQAAVLLPSVRARYSRRLAETLRGSRIPVHLVDGEDRSDHAGGGSAAGPHPYGHVLFTTIHQAKGREWPLVFVGGLHAADLRAEGSEVELGPYLTRDHRRTAGPSRRVRPGPPVLRSLLPRPEAAGHHLPAGTSRHILLPLGCRSVLDLGGPPSAVRPPANFQHRIVSRRALPTGRFSWSCPETPRSFCGHPPEACRAWRSHVYPGERDQFGP